MDIQLRIRDINLTSILLVIIVLTSRYHAHGLTCYICERTSASDSCITNPETSSTCNSKYCTIYRRELAEPQGIVTAFYRACEENPSYLNTKISTPYASSYYRACESDLCNTGDGRADVTTAAGVISTYEDGRLVVPGVAASNTENSQTVVGASSDVISTIEDGRLVIPGVRASNDASSIHFGTILAVVLITVAYVVAMYYE